MIRIRADLTPAALAAKVVRMFELSAAKIRSIERTWAPENGVARLHRGRPLCQPRLDRMDAGLSVRLRHPAIRRHRRARVSRIGRDRTVAVMAPHCQPHRRARPRLQQRQHLRQPAAPDERRAHPGKRVGAPFLRNGAQVFGRRAGGALVRAPPMAAATSTRSTGRTRCSSIPSARCARWWWPPARARPDGRERPQDFAARPRDSARARHRPVLGLLRRRARRLRRSRPHRAREHLQHQRRQLPLPQLAAGLLAVQHLDARAGLGHVRLRRAVGVSRHAGRTSRPTSPSSKRPPAPPATSTSRTRRPTASPTGTPARPASRNLGDWRGASGRPLQCARARR